MIGEQEKESHRSTRICNEQIPFKTGSAGADTNEEHIQELMRLFGHIACRERRIRKEDRHRKQWGNENGKEFTQLHNGSTIELAPRMLPSFAQLRAEKIVTRQNRYPRAP